MSTLIQLFAFYDQDDAWTGDWHLILHGAHIMHLYIHTCWTEEDKAI